MLPSRPLRGPALALTLALPLLLLSAVQLAHAQQPQAIPPNVSTVLAKPMVMLNMSRDHLLFTRAYNEYSDIDGDNLPDITYKHSFNYYGYFDSFKCYGYSGTAKRFEPTGLAPDKYCSGAWSGNFLNWLTMTKADVVRKILYGGYRSTDTASTTVLERAFLPHDAHSFAKYYVGADITRLTPFTTDQVSVQTTLNSGQNRHNRRYTQGSPSNQRWIYGAGAAPAPGAPTANGACTDTVNNYFNLSSPGGSSTAPSQYQCLFINPNATAARFPVALGDQIRLRDQSSNSTTQILGTVIRVDSDNRFGLLVTPASYSGENNNTSANWRFDNLTQSSVTFCNTTDVGPNEPPLLRAARGDHQLWAANERWQCRWDEDRGASNGNNPAITGLASSTSNPRRASLGLSAGSTGPDWVVRVQACVPGLLGNERCQQYPSGNHKPIGLLHEFGEDDEAEFALLTGSWAKNVSGGVLRSNMGSFSREVNKDTDGTFKPEVQMVHTLNRLRIWGYSYGKGEYAGCSPASFADLPDGSCTDWGNPMGEMFVESLRYLAGKQPLPAFAVTQEDSADAGLELPQPAWVDPLLRRNPTERRAVEARFGKAQCRAINVINFNSSVVSFDREADVAFSTLVTGINLRDRVNLVGSGEDIHGQSWFVGVAGSSTDTSYQRLCTNKVISALGEAEGHCPEAPASRGTFAIAGAAHWARTNPIRDDIRSNGNANAFTVKTYSVALSTSKPRIRIVQPGTGRVMELQPAAINVRSKQLGPATLVDFRILSQTPTSGRYLVIWEDAQAGSDYDQDLAGILRWEIVGSQVRVHTLVYRESTQSPIGFGYSVAGSHKDGAHFHSGAEGFTFIDPANITVARSDGELISEINASGGCDPCNSGQAETYADYSFVGTAAGLLPDPLLLAAKWGGFNRAGGADTPADPSSWDIRQIDGTAGADGIPDNYFLAIRPDELERALRTVFEDVISSSFTAPALGSMELTEGSLKFVARFDNKDGRGEVDAYARQADGTFSTIPRWKAHERLTAVPSNTRVVITNQVNAAGASQGGAALRWTSLSAATRATAFGTDFKAEARLNWLRGARNNEAPAGAFLRPRNNQSILGSVVNSNPHVQFRPRATFSGSAFPGYGEFVARYRSRSQLLWIGANDGMLHGFNASADLDTGGTPVLSYVPQPLHPQLRRWIDPSTTAVTALADGSPYTGDVLVGRDTAVWRTYLFSSLGRGGKGFFALDVTDPTELTEANAIRIFRWQFTESDDPSGDLGYNLEQTSAISRVSGQSAPIAKMNNGRFAIVVGNGVGSTSNTAALYVLFVNGPGANGRWNAGGPNPDYVKLTAVDPADPAFLPNGLSQPTWVDNNADGVADAIYAGDVRGNLWKFDVSHSDPARWTTAYSVAEGVATPLYKATRADADGTPRLQPIGTAPDYVAHPLGGRLIVLATGKALSGGDFPDPATRPHSAYGIWDKPALGSMSGAELAANLPRGQSRLVRRTLNRLPDGRGYLTGDANIDWNTKDGWVMDFPAASEMAVGNPVVVRPD
nr:PilC/PilY family type IV pilus protein [Serpentinimonas sp.]